MWCSGKKNVSNKCDVSICLINTWHLQLIYNIFNGTSHPLYLGLVLTITPAGTQNEPTAVLLFYSSNMNIIFCHVLYSPPISMLVNRVFEISGELQVELVLTMMPNALRVSSYCRIQSICCYAYVTMTLEGEGRRFGDLVVAGGTMRFHNDSLWCHQ